MKRQLLSSPRRSGATISSRMPEDEKEAAANICELYYPNLLITGPFSIILGFDGRLDGVKRQA